MRKDEARVGIGTLMARLDIKLLNEIVEKTVTMIQKSREEIFHIGELARSENERLRKELWEIQQEMQRTSRVVDQLEVAARQSRKRLAEASENYARRHEVDIQSVYQQASETQAELMTMRRREEELRRRRTELEYSVQRMEEMVRRAEALVAQVGMAMEILEGNWDLLNQQIRETENWQKLGIRVITAQEEERRRVAREIHDGPAQAIANLALRAELCERLTELNPESLRTELAELKEMVKATLHEVRKIIFDLRPMALDDLGLVPALRRYVENLEEHGELSVELVVHGSERRLPNEKEVVLFRVIQEALQNVHKHAETHFAMVKVEFLPTKVKAVVEDHGRGFILDEVFDRASRGGQQGFGLLSMRERLELCQGEFSIKTAPGKGTRIELCIPLLTPERERRKNVDGDFPFARR